MPVDLLQLPGHRLDAEIGRGGFGVVYRATRLSDDLVVAVKVLHRLLDDDAYVRFDAEIQVMGTLSWHPNIVRIIDAGSLGRPVNHAGAPGQLAYIVMEHLPNGSLGSVLRARGPARPDDVIRYCIQAATGLQVAHNAGLLHRDVKPDNLLIGLDGGIKISDFGVALAVRSAVGSVPAPASSGTSPTATSGPRGASGTLAYSAPELLGGELASTASDIYALGATMFALCSGDAAFHRTTDESAAAMILRAFREPLPDLRPHGVPEPLVRVIERAMAKEPDRRPHTAAHLAQELRTVGATLGIDLPPELPTGQPTPAAFGQSPRATAAVPGFRPPAQERARVQRLQRIATRVSAAALALIAVTVITVSNFSSQNVGDDAAAPPPAAEDAGDVDVGADAPGQPDNADEALPPPDSAAPPAPTPSPSPDVAPSGVPAVPFGLDSAPTDIGGDGARRYAVSATGITSFDTADGQQSVALALPGIVDLAVGTGDRVAVLTADGRIRILSGLLEPVAAPDLLATDLTFGAGSFWAATATGPVRIMPTDGGIAATTVTDPVATITASDSVIWTLTDEGLGIAVDPSTGEELTRLLIGPDVRSEAVDSDGTLLVATQQGLQAVSPDGSIRDLSPLVADRVVVDGQDQAFVLVGDQVSTLGPEGALGPLATVEPVASIGIGGQSLLLGLVDPPSVVTVR